MGSCNHRSHLLLSLESGLALGVVLTLRRLLLVLLNKDGLCLLAYGELLALLWHSLAERGDLLVQGQPVGVLLRRATLIDHLSLSGKRITYVLRQRLSVWVADHGLTELAGAEAYATHAA